MSLAVGDIIGGNAFEVMFLSAADRFYDGSIYAEFTEQDRTTGVIAMLMTAVLLLGVIRRQLKSPTRCRSPCGGWMSSDAEWVDAREQDRPNARRPGAPSPTPSRLFHQQDAHTSPPPQFYKPEW